MIHTFTVFGCMLVCLEILKRILVNSPLCPTCYVGFIWSRPRWSRRSQRRLGSAYRRRSGAGWRQPCYPRCVGGAWAPLDLGEGLEHNSSWRRSRPWCRRSATCCWGVLRGTETLLSLCMWNIPQGQSMGMGRSVHHREEEKNGGTETTWWFWRREPPVKRNPSSG